ncbi:putative amino acid transporter [Stachybotrys elegans]|uniref:Amino acid transporter n=1 Tax=Stachybotrys elegans TaxID=80388 RepID=A0A8K0WN46_9HYPO|nr:putative amino acid transporter [Stachybotrys elegans]
MSKLGAGTLAVGKDPVFDDIKYDGTRSDAVKTESQGSVGTSAALRPQQRKLHDKEVTFEEYYYYAQKTRAEEDEQPKTTAERSAWSLLFPSKSDTGVSQIKTDGRIDNKNLNDAAVRASVSDAEWTNASRALRTASRGAIFYLITTDILGPFGLPYAFATLGWGPGIALFTVFAVMAGYSGYLLWDMFLGLDSYEYPIRSYGDLGYRLYGPLMRHLFNFLQAAQLLLNVGLIVISNGEALSQAVKFQLCFAICCLIWAVVGFGIGQVRTLQKFGWLANAAVWLNLICMFITMGGASHSPPNYTGASQAAGASIGDGSSVAPDPHTGVYPPVMTTGGLPPSPVFYGSVSGAMQAIFAYGGAMVFPEFMAEMKRPKDFLTAMWCAQAFIYVCYMFYGLFMYGYQGQYTINPSYLGISKYSIQTAGNAFAMGSALIAAALYGNIGVKVLYNTILVEWFKAPNINSRGGKLIFAAMIPIYWAVAFVIAAGIPNFSGLTAVVSAFCILQFTYSFPPLLSVAFTIKKYAMREGEGWNPTTGHVVQGDRGLGRALRGFLGGRDRRRGFITVFNVLYCGGALAMAGLGAYSSIEVLSAAFAKSTTNSFVCKSPLQ